MTAIIILIGFLALLIGYIVSKAIINKKRRLKL
jgi:hypothetical protein